MPNTPPGRPRPADWKIADHGIGHIGLLVDDIDGEYARLSAAGMHFHAPPVIDTAPDGKGHKTTTLKLEVRG